MSIKSFLTFRKAQTHKERWDQLLVRESLRYGPELYWQLTKTFGIAWVRNCVIFWLFAMFTLQLICRVRPASGCLHSSRAGFSCWRSPFRSS